METISGFFLATRRVASRMISLASADPPGESTRRTTALTESSSAASSSALRMVVLKAPETVPNGLGSAEPVWMAPGQKNEICSFFIQITKTDCVASCAEADG